MGEEIITSICYNNFLVEVISFECLKKPSNDTLIAKYFGRISCAECWHEVHELISVLEVIGLVN